MGDLKRRIYSNSLKRQSSDRHVCWSAWTHYHVFARILLNATKNSKYVCTYKEYIVFDLIRLWIELASLRTRGEHANYCIAEEVSTKNGLVEIYLTFFVQDLEGISYM